MSAILNITEIAFRVDICNLRTLHLRWVCFADSHRAFAVVIERNVHLSTVVIGIAGNM